MSAPLFEFWICINSLTADCCCYYALLAAEVASDKRRVKPRRTQKNIKENKRQCRRHLPIVSFLSFVLLQCPPWFAFVFVIRKVDFLVSRKYSVLTRERRAIQNI